MGSEKQVKVATGQAIRWMLERILPVGPAKGRAKEYVHDCAGNVAASTDDNCGTVHYAYNN